jgi:hypothetical protein
MTPSPAAQELRELAAWHRTQLSVVSLHEATAEWRKHELSSLALDRWADEIDMERNINRVLE